MGNTEGETCGEGRQMRRVKGRDGKMESRQGRAGGAEDINTSNYW